MYWPTRTPVKSDMVKNKIWELYNAIRDPYKYDVIEYMLFTSSKYLPTSAFPSVFTCQLSFAIKRSLNIQFSHCTNILI